MLFIHPNDGTKDFSNETQKYLGYFFLNELYDSSLGFERFIRKSLRCNLLG